MTTATSASVDGLLELVIEQAAEAVMICDADGRIVHVNRAFSHVTGYESADVIGRRPEDSFWEEDRDDAAELPGRMETALAACGHWKGEGRARRKDGGLYVESRSVSIARDASGTSVGRMVVFSDVTREKEDERRLAFLAHHDALTGLPNRALCMHECFEAIARAQRRRSKVALLYVDLDDFKDVNDTHGHAAGDALLREIASRIQDCVRKTDVVARLGGDEFTVAIDDVQDARDVAVIGRKMLERVSEPFEVEGHYVRVSASVGIACYPDDAGDVDGLFAAADKAMYAAKEQGRNNCRYFSRDLNARALEALILANNLRQAIERDELTLLYQPRVELSTLRVTGVEALLRWRHPQLGMIEPGQFMAVAEKTGLIEELGDWVIRHACLQMAMWRRRGCAPPRIAVNVSARQFRSAALTAKIAAALAESGLAGDALEIEVAESTVMADPTHAAAVVRKIREVGAAIAIDDFGTGYSSLGQLQRLNADFIKIDQTFVRGLPHGPEARVADAIIAIARTLGVKLIAEGIETAEQLEYLRDAECGEGHGYLLSRPLAAEDVESVVAAGTICALRTVAREAAALAA